MDADRFRQDTDVLPKTPAQPAARAAGTAIGVAFSLAYFSFGHSKEK